MPAPVGRDEIKVWADIGPHGWGEERNGVVPSRSAMEQWRAVEDGRSGPAPSQTAGDRDICAKGSRVENGWLTDIGIEMAGQGRAEPGPQSAVSSVSGMHGKNRAPCTNLLARSWS